MSDEKHAHGVGPAAEAVGRMAFGLMYSRMLYAAAALNIAERLRQGPRSAEDLAAMTGTHAPSLKRLLRALVAYGVFSSTNDGLFALNELAETLTTAAPVPMRDMVLHFGSESQVATWSEVLFSVRTGAPAFEKVHGCGLFEFLATRPDEAARFNQVMSMGTGLAIPWILKSYDFSRCKNIVDVGGGNGALLAAVLAVNPTARGVLVECPAGIRSARENAQLTTFGSRVELLEGNFFEEIPAGSDTYLLKNVLHDWDDARSLAVLDNCRRAMTGESRLLIGEVIYDESDASSRGKLLDVSMLLLTGGRERSEAEYRDLCSRAGLGITRVIPTVGRYSLLVAELAR